MCASYPAVPKELAVAAVTVLSFFLVGGSGSGGAVLRTAVLILTLLPIVRLVVRPVRLAAVPFTVRITAENISLKTIQHHLLKLRSGNWWPTSRVCVVWARLRTCRHWAGR